MDYRNVCTLSFFVAKVRVYMIFLVANLAGPLNLALSLMGRCNRLAAT